MNFQIHCQIQDPTIRNGVINESRNQQDKSSKNQSLGLPSCSSYFSAFFKHNFFLLNYHVADFVLVFRSPRTCPTVPKSKIQHLFYEEKENVFKTKSRNVKGKIKTRLNRSVLTRVDGQLICLKLTTSLKRWIQPDKSK
jgi:hypothetical protein